MRGGSKLDSVQRVVQDDFRRAMSNFASGVNVITCYDEDGQPHGMTATAFCSVSREPALLLICVKRDTRTCERILSRGRFGVSMLSGNATEISEHCARPGADKRLPAEWLSEQPGAGAPVLASALAHTDCSIYDHQDVGTHTVFIGRVEQLYFGSATEPLIYFQGNYHRLQPASAEA